MIEPLSAHDRAVAAELLPDGADLDAATVEYWYEPVIDLLDDVPVGVEVLPVTFVMAPARKP